MFDFQIGDFLWYKKGLDFVLRGVLHLIEHNLI